MGIVADGDGVAMVHHLHLTAIYIFTMLSDELRPFAIDKGLIEDTQVFFCRQGVATDNITFCQTLHHPHIAILRCKDIGHHRCTFRKGHVT